MRYRPRPADTSHHTNRLAIAASREDAGVNAVTPTREDTMALPTNYAVISTVYGSDEKSPFMNILWFEVTGTSVPDPQTAAQNAVNLFSSAAALQYQAVMPTEAKWIGARIRLSLAGVAYEAGSAAGAGPGTGGSGDELPDYCAAIIRKRTNVAGKSGRGRWYIGAMSEASCDTSILTAGSITAYDSLGNFLNTGFTTSGLTFAPRHHSQKNNALYPIAFVKTQPNLGTQRRRRLRQTI